MQLETEAEVLEQIDMRIARAGYPHHRAEWHSEKVSEYSTIREVQFKVPITKSNRIDIIKEVYRIGAETNEAVVYLGATGSFQEGADLVLLLFKADIHQIGGC